MTKKIHERVLLDNGAFAPFSEKLIEKAVERQEREPVEPEIEEPKIDHGVKGKAELQKKSKKIK